MQVKDLMNPSAVTVEPASSAALAARLISRHNVGALPVCGEATRLMALHQVRRLPVVEGGKLVGMISLSDLARSGRFDMEAAQALSEISENIVVR